MLRKSLVRTTVLLAVLCQYACSFDADTPADSVPAAASDSAAGPFAAQLRYDREYPVMQYSSQAPENPVTELAARLSAGEASLAAHPVRGYLDDLLRALEIDPASQTLVFSKTSQQVDGITAATPRAIYFSDDVYVAWVPGATSLEIAAIDANLGAVFFTLQQTEPAAVEQRFELCLSCHDSYSMTGGGVPRMITGSGYTGVDGTIVAHEGWILTSDRTPLRSRWGGWYVSGMHGEQVHLGNIAVDSVYDLEDLESLRNGNHADLRQLIDVAPYLTDTSDIVALLVLEHQITVQNAIVRLNWDLRQALAERQIDAEDPQVTPAEVGIDVEPLARALVFAGTPTLTDTIAGTAGFETAFLARGLRDSSGRSLRDFDLETRLFRYPLSFVINSQAFAALPLPAKRAVLVRVRAALTGEDFVGFAFAQDLDGGIRRVSP